MSLRVILAAGAAAISVGAVASAGPQPSAAIAKADAKQMPLEAGEGRAVALKLADELVRSFVFRDTAEDYAAMLRKNAAAGRYDTGKRGDIATLMTEDLLAVHKDGHLHLEVAEPDEQEGASNGPPKGFPPLIQSARTIAPGVGYIRFTAFAGKDDEVAAVRKWLSENRNANTLIFDLRNHHGGGLKEQDAIFAEVFAKPTPLVTMALAKSVYDERGSMFGNVPTLHFAAAGRQDDRNAPGGSWRSDAAAQSQDLPAGVEQDRFGRRAFLARDEIDGARNADRRSDGRREPLRRTEGAQ